MKALHKIINVISEGMHAMLVTFPSWVARQCK